MFALFRCLLSETRFKRSVIVPGELLELHKLGGCWQLPPSGSSILVWKQSRISLEVPTDVVAVCESLRRKNTSHFRQFYYFLFFICQCFKDGVFWWSLMMESSLIRCIFNCSKMITLFTRSPAFRTSLETTIYSLLVALRSSAIRMISTWMRMVGSFFFLLFFKVLLFEVFAVFRANRDFCVKQHLAVSFLLLHPL